MISDVKIQADFFTVINDRHKIFLYMSCVGITKVYAVLVVFGCMSEMFIFNCNSITKCCIDSGMLVHVLFIQQLGQCILMIFPQQIYLLCFTMHSNYTQCVILFKAVRSDSLIFLK
jgi:hypothetical protein